MSDALHGMHYCAEHQGNSAHYDKKNCDLCKALGNKQPSSDAVQWVPYTDAEKALQAGVDWDKCPPGTFTVVLGILRAYARPCEPSGDARAVAELRTAALAMLQAWNKFDREGITIAEIAKVRQRVDAAIRATLPQTKEGATEAEKLPASKERTDVGFEEWIGVLEKRLKAALSQPAQPAAREAEKLVEWCERMAEWCELEDTPENDRQFTEKDRQNWLACAAALRADGGRAKVPKSKAEPRAKTAAEIAEEWKDWIPYPDSTAAEWDRYKLACALAAPSPSVNEQADKGKSA